MANITRETYEANDIEVIADKLGKLWLNERHVEKKLGHKNLPALTNQYPKEYKKQRSELNESTNQPNRRFIHVDLALKVIMNSRTDESCKFKRNLGFTLHDVINTKEQTVINSIKDAFEGEHMQTQHTILGYRIDLYFHKYKLAIEVDKLGHNNRSADHETQRQRALERELNCAFIIINPAAADFNICKEIIKICRHINQSTIQKTEQKTKKSLIDNLPKELLELEFKHHNQLLTKFLKWIVKNILSNYKS